MKSVLLVCEAGKGNGLGHFYRSVAMAETLSNDFSIMLLSNNTSLPDVGFKTVYVKHFEDFEDYDAYDLLILDGYRFSSKLISKLDEQSIRFVEISDFEEQLYPTPFWINTSLKSDLPGKSLKYSLLRKDLLKIARTRTFEAKTLDAIFIAFGGTDELSNSLKAVQTFHDTHYFSKIGVLYPKTGKDFPVLEEYASSDLDSKVEIFSHLSTRELIEITDQYTVAFVSSSTIACEMIALRKVVFTCCLYDNQQLLHQQLTESNAAIHADLDKILGNPESLVVDLMHPEIHLGLSQHELFDFQKQLIDGHSQERMLNFISNCIEE